MQALLDEENDQDDGSGSSGTAPEPSSRPPPYDHDLLDFDPDDELDEDDLVTADLNVYDRELLEEGSGEDVNDNKQRSDEENVSPFPETFKKKVGSLDSDVPTRSKFESEKSGPQDLMNIKFDNVPQNNTFRGRGRGQNGRGHGPQNGRGMRNNLKTTRRGQPFHRGGPSNSRLFGHNPNDERQPQNYPQDRQQRQPQPHNMRYPQSQEPVMRHPQSQDREMRHPQSQEKEMRRPATVVGTSNASSTIAGKGNASA